MIKGSLVPNITFFDARGDLDIEKTKWHMRWMFEKGLDGLFLTGSYGSGPKITSSTSELALAWPSSSTANRVAV